MHPMGKMVHPPINTPPARPPDHTQCSNNPHSPHPPIPQPPRFRELGCVCAPVKGSDYKEGKSYQVSLLQQSARSGQLPKTLGECLPKPKGPPKARGR